MAAAVVTEPTGKRVGATTMGATAGTGLAGAAAVVLVWILTQVGVQVPAEVSAALAVLIGGVGALVGGKLTPTSQTRTEAVLVPQLAPEAEAVPDGTGEHRAVDDTTEAAGSTAVTLDPVEVAPVVTDTVVEVQ